MHDDTLSVEDESARPSAHDSPVLFVVIRCDQVVAAPHRFNLAAIDEVLFGRGDMPPSVDARVLKISIPDPRMSLPHARLRRSDGRFVLHDLESKNGSLVNGLRAEETSLGDGDLIELGGTFLIFRWLDDGETGGAQSLLGIDTLLPRWARELAAARDVSRSSVPLLLLGETGTGKEVVARAAHAESGRGGSLVPVNCAALPAALVESELFGTKKGAFSGADTDRSGLIAAAHKGTLFLDEIGELPMTAQAALLRVLQDGQVTPLGATKAISYDVRVISATNRDLPALVTSGRFRADLYARLTGFKLYLWPLRERREDIGLLVASLVRRLAPERAASLTFSLAAARCLFHHDWPLNIRELEKALAAALALSPGRIERAHLQLAPPSPAESPRAPADVPHSPEHDERRQKLIELLALHDGNISAVAREMGKDRVQIRRWLRMYQLDAKR